MTFKTIYADFHIHLGRSPDGKPVKITASPQLTIERVLETAEQVKGLNMIGVIDCHVPSVLDYLDEQIERGNLCPLDGGGLQYGEVTLILGCELEVYDQHCSGPVHILAYFPQVEHMRRFQMWLQKRVTNPTLSSQRVYASAVDLQQAVKEHSGSFFFAHAFTPFKSLYGKGVKTSLTEAFDPALVDGVELGLSSNTEMANQIRELDRYPFMANSDAHSHEKMAREYQALCVEAPTLKEWLKALKAEDGRHIQAYYGLNPYLGKYYLTVCASCGRKKEEHEHTCPACGSTSWIKGVSERIRELKRLDDDRPPLRPPYIPQVPLEFIPGIGPKTLEHLRSAFHTDMNILHDTSREDLLQVIPKKKADLIIAARKGQLAVEIGGGGRYGKIKT